MFIIVYLSRFMSEQFHVSQILPLMERRGTSFARNREKSKACKGSPSLKACLMARQKPSMPGSARPREGEQTPKRLKKLSKACKGSPSLKACLMARQKPSMPGSARPREGSRIPTFEESKACKGSPSLKACLMARQKPSVPGSARPREGKPNPRH